MKPPFLNLNPKLCIATLMAVGLIAPPQDALAKKKNTSGSERKVKALEAENAQLRQQLSVKQEELLKATQAMPAAKDVTVKAASNPFGATELPSRNKPLAAAEMSCGANMGKMKMEPGDQFLFNPVFGGGEMFNAHPKGMGMFNAKWMHMQMNGLQAGTSSINPSQVGLSAPGGKYPYMMVPTRMFMDMFMGMGMYGVTDRLTLMGMLNYQTSSMDMFMDMGKMSKNPLTADAPMNTGGIGDTELDAIYKIHDSKLGSVTGTVGLSIPTGSVAQQTEMMGKIYRAPYDMQLGSGTYDFKPALTYNWVSDNALWNLGGQASGIVHMSTSNGWAYGNGVKLSSWIQRGFGPATTWFRLRYTDTAQIQGSDPNIQKLLIGASTPDANPLNYGGQVLNALIGASYKFNAFSFGLEGGLPVYQNLNGLQMSNGWQVTSGFQAMF